MSQDTYKINPDIGFAGQEQGIGDRFARSFTNKTEVIPFGRIVIKEEGSENGVKLPFDARTNFEGVVIAARGEQVGNQFAIGKDIPVLKRGTIIVETEQSVTPDDPIFTRFTGKSQTQTIVFSADFVGGNAINLKIDDVSTSAEMYFATDHASTMAAIATQILADFKQIATCTVNGRTLTLTHKDHGKTFVISNVVVTGGASQSTATINEICAPISDDDRGKFRKDEDLDVNGNASAVQIDGIKFTRNSVNGLVEIDINIV